MSSGAIKGGAGAFDVGSLIDMGCDFLGLKGEAKAAAKMGATFLQNGIGAFSQDQSVHQASAVQQEPAARTEMPPSPSAAQASQGYAQSATAGAGRREVMKFDSPEVLNWIPPDGPGAENLTAMRSRFDLENDKPSSLGRQGGKTDYMQYLSEQLRSFPNLRAAFEKDFGVKIDMSAYDQKGGMVVFREPQAAQCAATGKSNTAPPATGTANQAGDANHPAETYQTGSAGQTNAATPATGNGSGHLDPNIEDYRDCLQTLLENWEVFDTAVGKRDSFMTKANLEAMRDFPAAHPKLKAAAEFLLKHEEYFNRLEMAAGVGGKDGIVGKGDVVGDLSRVKKEIAEYGPPRTSSPAQNDAATGANATGGSAGANQAKQTTPALTDRDAMVDGTSNPLKDLMSDPLMSLEDKIDRILSRAMGSLDKQVEAAASKAAGNPEDTVAQQDLQKLVQRRSQMFTLMSTISANFHQMSMTAIHNMGKA